MNLLLSRHGNTFGPGDPVVWTGATNDLPLVQKGVEQAEKLAQALIAHQIRPIAVYCSPLQRTARYAAIVIERLKLPVAPTVDPRLNEIDYGEWTGLTNPQVKERFGEAALRGWDERSIWPTQGGWSGSPAEAIDAARSFVLDLARRYTASDTVLVVSSNGRLRYFLTLVPGEFERRVLEGSFKVKTGHLCKLVYEDGKARIPFWNESPDAI